MSDTCPTCGSDKRGERLWRSLASGNVVWALREGIHDQRAGLLCADPWHDQPEPGNAEHLTSLTTTRLYDQPETRLSKFVYTSEFADTNAAEAALDRLLTQDRFLPTYLSDVGLLHSTITALRVEHYSDKLAIAGLGEEVGRLEAENEWLTQRLTDEQRAYAELSHLYEFTRDQLDAQAAQFRALLEAAVRLQYSDKVFHGLKHSEVESEWGDTEKCDLCALRAAVEALRPLMEER